MDIRDCFRATAAAAAADSRCPESTSAEALSVPQMCVLTTWTLAAAQATREAWARFQASEGQLLFEANLQLLPRDFAVAFDVCVTVDDEGRRTIADVQKAVLAALDLALSWWRVQEALHSQLECAVGCCVLRASICYSSCSSLPGAPRAWSCRRRPRNICISSCPVS